MMHSMKTEQPLDFTIKSMHHNANADSRASAVTPPCTLNASAMSLMNPFGAPNIGLNLDAFALQQMLMSLSQQPKQHAASGSDPTVTMVALNAINRRKRRAAQVESNESTPTKRSVSREDSHSDCSSPSKHANSTNGSKAEKDESYWERRRRNNEAAKRSRDSRRNKEEDVARRAAFLEQENLQLRAQVTILKNETAKLHYLLLSNAATQQKKMEEASAENDADTTSTSSHLSPPLSMD